MKTTKTVGWTAPNGKSIEVIITVEKYVKDNISFSDGWNINLGPETHEFLNITVKADGEIIGTSREMPNLVDPNSKNTNGAYGEIGNKVGMKKDRFEQIMAVIDKLKNEVETVEFTETKVKETAKETAKVASEIAKSMEYHQAVKNGLCQHCGTYCDGDCQSN